MPTTIIGTLRRCGHTTGSHGAPWLQNVGERTLIPALIPPGAAHVHTVSSAGLPSGDRMESLCVSCGMLSSLLADFATRAAPKSAINIKATTQPAYPSLSQGHPLQPALIMRVLRLNCVTKAYADLWRSVYRGEFTADQWAGGRLRENRPALGELSGEWSTSSPLRIAEDRRQALVEIDALVALMLDVTRTSSAPSTGPSSRSSTVTTTGITSTMPKAVSCRTKSSPVAEEG